MLKAITAEYVYSEAQDTASSVQAALHSQRSNSTRDPRPRRPTDERSRINHSCMLICRRRVSLLRDGIADYVYSEGQDPESGGQPPPHTQASNSTRDPRPRRPTDERPRMNHDCMFIWRIRMPLLRDSIADYVYSEGQDPESGGQAPPHTQASNLRRDHTNHTCMFICKM